MSQTFDHTLAAATELAASGNYAAATATLESVSDPEAAVRVHLLRGKILAQQARFSEAISEWEKVLAVEPQNKEALAGVTGAGRLRGRWAGKVFLRARLYLGLLLFAAIVALAVDLLSRRAPASENSAPLLASLLAQNEAVRKDLGQLREQHKALAMAFDQTTNLLAETQRQAADAQKAQAEASREYTQLSQLYSALSLELTNLAQSSQAASRQASNDLAARGVEMERLAKRIADQETDENSLREKLAAQSFQAAADHSETSARIAVLTRSLNDLTRSILAERLSKLSAERDYLQACERELRMDPHVHLESQEARQRRDRLQALDQEIRALELERQALPTAPEEIPDPAEKSRGPDGR